MSKRLFFILLLAPFFTNAQIVSDAKLWTGISISKKVNEENKDNKANSK